MVERLSKRKIKTGPKYSPEERKLSRKKKKELKAKQKEEQTASAKLKAAKRLAPKGLVLTQEEIDQRIAAKQEHELNIQRQQALRGESKYLLSRYNSIIGEAKLARNKMFEHTRAKEIAEREIISWGETLVKSKERIKEFYQRLDDFDNDVSHSKAHRDLKEGDRVLWGWHGILDAGEQDDAYGIVMQDALKGQPVQIKQLHRNDLSIKLLREEIQASEPEEKELVGEDEPCEENNTPKDAECACVHHSHGESEGTTAQEAMA